MCRGNSESPLQLGPSCISHPLSGRLQVKRGAAKNVLVLFPTFVKFRTDVTWVIWLVSANCRTQQNTFTGAHTQSPNIYSNVLPGGELFFLVLFIRCFPHKQKPPHFMSLILNNSNTPLITFLLSFSPCSLSLNLTLSLCSWAAEDWTKESVHIHTPESVHLYLLCSTAKCHHHYDSTWQTADIRIFTLCVSCLLRWTKFLLSCTSWKALFLAIKSMKNYWPLWITQNEFIEIDDTRNILHFRAPGSSCVILTIRLWLLYTVTLKRLF